MNLLVRIHGLPNPRALTHGHRSLWALVRGPLNPLPPYVWSLPYTDESLPVTRAQVPLTDHDGNPLTDHDGNPLYSHGTVGTAWTGE